jgi:hypothetical protein
MNFAAFEQLPDGDGFHRELIEGDFQLLPPRTAVDILLINRVLRKLMEAEGRTGVHVFAGAGYKLSDQPRTWIQPDISVLRDQRGACC